MKKMIAIILLVLFTSLLTAIATFNFIIVNQEIEQTETGYTITILGNVYDYE